MDEDLITIEDIQEFIDDGCMIFQHPKDGKIVAMISPRYRFKAEQIGEILFPGAKAHIRTQVDDE